MKFGSICSGTEAAAYAGEKPTLCGGHHRRGNANTGVVPAVAFVAGRIREVAA
jgi:hypothetical protein